MNNDSIDTSNELMNDLNETLLKNILDRRLLLTKKIVITEKFFEIFLECDIFNIQINKDSTCKLKGEIIRVDELLKCLLLTSHTYPNDINIDTTTKIYILLKINLEEDKNLFVITNEQKEMENKISPENQKEIEYLQKQKEGLIKQKEKAEQMLNVLKIFMESKEKYLSDKEKYKKLLFVLTKVYSKEGKQIDINRVEELLRKDDIENVIFTEDEINENETEIIDKLEVNEKLFKEIENALMNRINDFFQEEKITTQKILTERDREPNEEKNDNDKNNNNAKENSEENMEKEKES
jgi:hypothetical protein